MLFGVDLSGCSLWLNPGRGSERGSSQCGRRTLWSWSHMACRVSPCWLLIPEFVQRHITLPLAVHTACVQSIKQLGRAVNMAASKRVSFAPSFSESPANRRQLPRHLKNPKMTTIEVFREFQSGDITDAELAGAAQLFGDHYGVWDTPPGRQGGKPGDCPLPRRRSLR